jgi:squalene-hopene/tetraprenyl-beta-curcumene cyclase
METAAAWLVKIQNQDGGWGGAMHVRSSVEETALAVEALACIFTAGVPAKSGSGGTILEAMVRGATWLIERVESGEWKKPAPIGFYFAKLWYCERLYPLIFTVGALNQAARAARHVEP